MNINQELLTTAKSGQSSLAEELLDQGADINYQDQEGKTALIWALKNNKPRMVKLLLNRGANPNLGDNSGETPLHIAVGLSNPNLVQELLNAGANPNVSNSYGELPLPRAINNIRKGNTAIVQALLKAGANPNFNPTRFNLLHSIQGVNPDVFQLLVEALRHGDLELVKSLIDAGTIRNLSPEGIEHLRTQANFNPNEETRKEILQLLNQKETLNPGITNPEGITNLMIIASHPEDFPLLEKLNPEVVRPIVNQQDDEGNTALIYAVVNNPNPEVIRFLLENGANPLIKNNQGYTALDYAQDLGEEDLLRLMEKFL